MSKNGIKKSMFFWLGFRMPLETLTDLRRGREEAAGKPRGSRGGGREDHTFASRCPRAAPLIKDIVLKQTKTGMVRDLARPEPLARRIC